MTASSSLSSDLALRVPALMVAAEHPLWQPLQAHRRSPSPLHRSQTATKLACCKWCQKMTFWREQPETQSSPETNRGSTVVRTEGFSRKFSGGGSFLPSVAVFASAEEPTTDTTQAHASRCLASPHLPSFADARPHTEEQEEGGPSTQHRHSET